MARELEKAYEPKDVESRIYQFWLERDAFAAPVDPERTPFCVTIPPPNVTGELHMGHALQHSIHDLIVRRKRMQGFNVLFQPGYDHAGISTQNAVEKSLAAEGTSRRELGREAFEQRVWDWLHLYGGKVVRPEALVVQDTDVTVV